MDELKTEGFAFPSPTSYWGMMTHAVMPNPKRRWWSFWRPRVIVQTIPVPVRMSNYVAASATACSTLSGEAVLKKDHLLSNE